MSALQENDVSWILVGSGSAVTACPPTHAQEAPIIRWLERVLTGAGMNHKVELIGTKQVGFQLDNQKTKMIKWDVATVPFPIASVRRLTMQANLVVFEEREEDGVGGTWQGPVAESEDLDQCAMEWCRDKSTGGSSRERDLYHRWVQVLRSPWTYDKMNIRQELMHGETHGSKVRVRPDPRNPSKAERDEHHAAHLSPRSWCEHCVAGKMPDLLSHTRRSSECDVPDTKMDYFLMDHKSDSEPMTVLYFLDCELGCTFACPVDKGPGNFPVGVICKGLEFCGRRRLGHAISALWTAVRSAQWNCSKSRRKSPIRHFINFTAVRS